MKKIMMLAAMLAMVFAAAAPAVAQDVDASDDDGIDDDSTTTTDIQYGDSAEVGGDVNTQSCNNIIGDVDVSAGQYNTGDNLALGDDSAQAIAQEQGVSVAIVQQCFQALNTGTVVAGPVDDGGEVVHPEGVVHPEDDGGDDYAAAPEAGDDAAASDDAAAASDDAAAASASYSVLPDTGGASLIALGAGALLVAGGLVARRIVR